MSERGRFATLWLLILAFAVMGAAMVDHAWRAQAASPHAWRPTPTWHWQPAPALPTYTPCPPLVRIPQTRAVVTATPIGTVTPTSIYLWPTITPAITARPL